MRIVFTFACTHLIGRRNHTAITIVPCHMKPKKLAVKKHHVSKAKRGIVLTNQSSRCCFYAALLCSDAGKILVQNDCHLQKIGLTRNGKYWVSRVGSLPTSRRSGSLNTLLVSTAIFKHVHTCQRNECHLDTRNVVRPILAALFFSPEL